MAQFLTIIMQMPHRNPAYLMDCWWVIAWFKFNKCCVLRPSLVAH